MAAGTEKAEGSPTPWVLSFKGSMPRRQRRARPSPGCRQGADAAKALQGHKGDLASRAGGGGKLCPVGKAAYSTWHCARRRQNGDGSGGLEPQLPAAGRGGACGREGPNTCRN